MFILISSKTASMFFFILKIKDFLAFTLMQFSSISNFSHGILNVSKPFNRDGWINIRLAKCQRKYDPK